MFETLRHSLDSPAFIVAMVALVVEIAQLVRARSLTRDMRQMRQGLEEVTEHELPAILADVKVRLEERRPPVREAAEEPFADAVEDGRRHGRARATELYERSLVHEGTTLISESLEPVSEKRADLLRSAPNKLVMLALVATILGLIITLLSLSSILGANGSGGSEAVVEAFGAMWWAFVPTLFGLAFGLRVSSWAEHVLLDWDKALHDLDRCLLSDVVTERSQQDANLERAAQELNSAARSMSGAGQTLESTVEPFRAAVQDLSGKIDKLDTDSVITHMQSAAEAFGTKVGASAEQLAGVCEQLVASGKMFAPQVDVLQGVIGEVSSAAAGLQQTTRVAVETLEQFAGSLVPMLAAAEGMSSNLETIATAQRELVSASQSLSNRTGELTDVVKELQHSNQPVIKELREAATAMVKATEGFEQVAKQLQDNAQIIESTLHKNASEMRTCNQRLERITDDWGTLINGALAGQREFNERSVSALISALHESPPQVKQLAAVGEQLAKSSQRLNDSADAVAAMREGLDQRLDNFNQEVGAATSDLRDLPATLRQELSDAGIRQAVTDFSQEVGRLRQEVGRLTGAQEKAVDRLVQQAASGGLEAAVGNLSKQIEALGSALPRQRASRWRLWPFGRRGGADGTPPAARN